MEQFSLEKYLENPSCKVVTRRGNPVRIICTDRKHGEDNLPIVFLERCHNGEFLLACRKDGRCDTYDTQYDLFFADENDELTELQKTLEEDCDYYVNLYNDGKTREELREWIKCWCNSIIDLAKKEILKDLPKWKRTTDPTRKTRSFLGIGAYELYDGKGFYIELDELDKLPKE